MSIADASAAAYVTAQKQMLAQLPGGGISSLDAHRAGAVDQLARLGLPSQRDEDWKYTSIRSITKSAFTPAEPGGDCPATFFNGHEIANLNALRLVFVDGFFAPALSDHSDLPRGLHIGGMAQGLRDDGARLAAHLGTALGSIPHGFAAMNSAFVADGACVELEAGLRIDRPIELIFVCGVSGEGLLSLPRNLIRLGVGSQATVIERYLSFDRSRGLNNTLTEIILDEGATLDHCVLQSLGERMFHVGGLFASVAKDATLRSTTVTTSGALVRNDARVNLDGERASVHLDGCYLAFGRSHIDNHTHIAHNHPNGISRETYKGVLGDRGRAVFHGRIVVKPDAQKTDSEQNNQNLLLSEEAEIDTKPQLEIYADDVKCAHGATVGQLDETALFYLVSRGVDRATARRMLTQAFAADVLNGVQCEPLREHLQHLASARLDAALSEQASDQVGDLGRDEAAPVTQ
jgi:Fe-S cluster assembly protein SufD